MTDQEKDQLEDESVSERDSESVVVVEEVVTDGRDYRVEGNDVSGYIGVSPEYMTYANETERPLLTSQEEWNYTHNLDHLEGNEPDESGESVEVEKEDKEESEVEVEAEDDPEKKKQENPTPVRQTVVSPVITS